MTTPTQDHIHFVVAPPNGRNANVTLESGGRPIGGFVVSWMGFLIAGDRGQRAAIHFIAEQAPAHIRVLVQRTLEAGWTFYLNRTVVTPEEIADGFDLDHHDQLIAA